MAERTMIQRKRRAALFAAAALIWSAVFAALSFYWALGGRAGSQTIGPAITDLAQDPAFIAVLWITAVLKALLALLALALLRLPRWRLARRALRAAAWAVGLGMALYGAASFVQHALMLAGSVRLPTGLGETAARWHLLLWDPWWALGGVLFAAAAWQAGQARAGEGLAGGAFRQPPY